MIIELFAVFVVISFVMIYIGLTNSTESAQALIGFFFLFLLSFVLINSNLEYKTGEQRNTTYAVNFTSETIVYNYQAYSDTTSLFNTKRAGIYLTIASAIGFIGVLFSLRGSKNGDI